MVRVKANLHESTYQMLMEIAQRREITPGQALAHAIAWAHWIEEQRWEGNKLLIEQNGTVREIIPPGGHWPSVVEPNPSIWQNLRDWWKRRNTGLT